MGMNRVLTPLAAAALFFTVSPATADTKSDIQKVYNKLCAAMKKGDMKTLMASGTSDFKMKEMGVTKNAEEVRKEMQGMFAGGFKVNKCVMTVKSVALKGKIATVRTVSHMDALMPGGPNGKKMHMVSSGESRDILVKTPQGWKFKLAESLDDKAKVTMDGKPFDPKMMMAPPPKKK